MFVLLVQSVALIVKMKTVLEARSRMTTYCILGWGEHVGTLGAGGMKSMNTEICIDGHNVLGQLVRIFGISVGAVLAQKFWGTLPHQHFITESISSVLRNRKNNNFIQVYI